MPVINVSTETERERLSQEFYKNLATNARIDELDGDILATDWADRIIETTHYINNIFDNPKRFLEVEEIIVDISKSKKTDSDSVKHLAKHSNFISEWDEETNKIKPNKIMNAYKEDTFDLYENRFAYSLVNLIEDMVHRFSEFTDEKDSRINERFNYTGNSIVNKEKISCKVIVTSANEFNGTNDLPAKIKKKIAIVKNSLAGWKNSALYKALDAKNIPNVSHPIKRTNTILKNPNFQAAADLWDFLYPYEIGGRNTDSSTATEGLSNDAKSLVNNSMFLYYLIMKKLNTDKVLGEGSYAAPMKEAAMGVLTSVTSMILELDKNMKKEDLMNEAGRIYDNIQRTKGLDASEVGNKIKKTIKEYLDTVSYSFFTLNEEGIVVDTESLKEEEAENKNPLMDLLNTEEGEDLEQSNIKEGDNNEDSKENTTDSI